MPRPLHGSSHSIAERQPKVADEHSALKLCRDGGSAQTSACSTCRHLRAARSTRPHPTPASPSATSPRPTLGKQAHSRGAESQPRRQPSQPVGAGPQLHFNLWVEPPVTVTETSQPHHLSPAHPRPPEISGHNGRPSTSLHPHIDLYSSTPTATCLPATPLPAWDPTTPSGVLPRSCRRRQPFPSALPHIISPDSTHFIPPAPRRRYTSNPPEPISTRVPHTRARTCRLELTQSTRRTPRAVFKPRVSWPTHPSGVDQRKETGAPTSPTGGTPQPRFRYPVPLPFTQPPPPHNSYPHRSSPQLPQHTHYTPHPHSPAPASLLAHLDMNTAPTHPSLRTVATVQEHFAWPSYCHPTPTPTYYHPQLALIRPGQLHPTRRAPPTLPPP